MKKNLPVAGGGSTIGIPKKVPANSDSSALLKSGNRWMSPNDPLTYVKGVGKAKTAMADTRIPPIIEAVVSREMPTWLKVAGGASLFGGLATTVYNLISGNSSDSGMIAEKAVQIAESILNELKSNSTLLGSNVVTQTPLSDLEYTQFLDDTARKTGLDPVTFIQLATQLELWRALPKKDASYIAHRGDHVSVARARAAYDAALALVEAIKLFRDKVTVSTIRNEKGDTYEVTTTDHPATVLDQKEQAAADGISDDDFDSALNEALRDERGESSGLWFDGSGEPLRLGIPFASRPVVFLTFDSKFRVENGSIYASSSGRYEIPFGMSSASLPFVPASFATPASIALVSKTDLLAFFTKVSAASATILVTKLSDPSYASGMNSIAQLALYVAKNISSFVVGDNFVIPSTMPNADSVTGVFSGSNLKRAVAFLVSSLNKGYIQ